MLEHLYVYIIASEGSRWLISPCLARVSPICFNLSLYSADEMRWAGVRIGGREIHVNNLRYADDIALTATSLQRLQKFVGEVDQFSNEKKIWKKNNKKTKNNGSDQNLKRLNVRCRDGLCLLSEVEHFKYLGADIKQTEDCDKNAFGCRTFSLEFSHTFVARSCIQQKHRGNS